MSSLDSLTHWLEATRVARAVGDSMWIIASLSAIHVFGYALVMGAALIGGLRLLGLVVPSLPVQDVARPAGRGMAWGLAISVVTGLLLVSWKAVAASANGFFRAKILFLVLAVAFHFTWQRRLSRSAVVGQRGASLAGAIALLLWLALAVAAAAHILFE